MRAEHWPTSDLPVRERRLHTLNLAGTAIAPEDVARLRRSRPQLKILTAQTSAVATLSHVEGSLGPQALSPVVASSS